MIRRFTRYLAMCAVWFSVASCNDDEVAAPPQPTFDVDKTSAEVGEDVTFTIDQVNAQAISILPYGLPSGDAGVLVKNFTDGVATVVFQYQKPGTFQAIAVANNHSGDGESVKSTQSEPFTITITSSKNEITDFIFDKISTATTIDQGANTINVTVPYGTDITKLKATYTASGFTTVTVGGTTQTNGTTENNFTNPVVYTVTADNGDVNTYTVTVTVTPIETLTTIKSVSAKAVSTAAKNKELGVSVDNANNIIVVYDTLGTPASQFDSVRVGYALDGKFAILKFGGKPMKQDSLLNLTSPKEFDVYSQDSTNAGGIQTYDVYAVAAPKMHISFPSLVPDPAVNVKPTNFGYEISVLDGTDLNSIDTDITYTLPAGVSIVGVTVNGNAFTPGDDVDYSEPAKFELRVDDTNLGVEYTVTYTVTLVVVP